jgi:hypothetical protein
MNQHSRLGATIAGLALIAFTAVGLTYLLGTSGRAPHSRPLDSPLPPADQPIPVPHEYYPTRMPVEQRASAPVQWQTYEIPGEGLTFKARRDWAITSGKNRAMKYTAVYVVPRYSAGSIVFAQLDNPQGLPLEAFAKTSATSSDGSPHDAKWLAADIKQYARDVSNSQYKRLLIVRDDSKNQATASISGPSLYTVLIAKSEEGMSPEAEQHFWEVLDSIQFTPIQ